MNAPKPTNFNEMYVFYRELAKVNPWPTTKHGGYTAKGNPIERQMDPEELDAVIRQKAAEMGWTVPEPVFQDEVPF